VHNPSYVLANQVSKLRLDNHEQMRFLQQSHKHVENRARLSSTERLQQTLKTLSNLFPELSGLIVELVLFLSEFKMALFAVGPTETGLGNLAIVVSRLSANDTQPILAADLRHRCHHLAHILMHQVQQVLVVDKRGLNLLVDLLATDR
jgi:hypothetical protein